MFMVTMSGFKQTERTPGMSVEESRGKTEGRLVVDGDVPEMVL